MRNIAVVVLGVLFLAACGESSSLSAAPGSGPLDAFRAYRKALADGDLSALRSCLAEEQAAEIEGKEAEQVLPLLRMMMPEDETIDGLSVDGADATLKLTAGDPDNLGHGVVAMKREGGEWKVVSEKWHFGDVPGEESGATDEAATPDPEPEGDWRFDLAGREIPDQTATGTLAGRPFTVARAEITENGILTLSDGDILDSTGRFMVFLFVPEGESLSGQTYDFARTPDPMSDRSAHVHLHWTDAEGNLQSDAQISGFALRLVFGEEADGRLPGRIWLAYPDEAKSRLVGTFEAERQQ